MLEGCQLFVVLGMHRSGTSAVAGTLHHLGIHLGDSLLGANRGNPKGHYESIPFVQLNNEILKQAGGGWKYPPSRKRIENCGFPVATLQRFLEKEKKVIWGLKDPRTVLTLPLWKPYFEQIAQVYYVLVYRNFDEVVRSLARRDRISERRAERILQPYLKNLYHYRHTAGWQDLQWLDIHYDHLLQDPAYYVAKINRILKRESMYALNQVTNFLDTRLNRQGTHL